MRLTYAAVQCGGFLAFGICFEKFCRAFYSFIYLFVRAVLNPKVLRYCAVRSLLFGGAEPPAFNELGLGFGFFNVLLHLEFRVFLLCLLDVEVLVFEVP